MLYVMLSGTQPFNGADDNEIIEAVRFGEVVLHTSEWRKKSRDCIDFIRSLLMRDFRKRCSA